ncbi:MAG: hypothetical protein WCG01_01015 [bacterium]
MTEIVRKINRKLYGIAFTFISTGVAFALLSATIVWVPMAVQVILGVLALVWAFGFIYFGLKVLSIKHDIERLLKL